MHPEIDVLSALCFCFGSLEKEILDRYLEVVLKGNKDGLKVFLLHWLILMLPQIIGGGGDVVALLLLL